MYVDVPQGSGLVAFLKGWGSLSIATLALIRPWLSALWNRLFRRADIDIHPTTRIEVGYGGLGPTIGLTGTLRAIHRDQFVESIHLLVTKSKDGSHHEFDWILSRAGKFSASGTEVSAELVSGLMLTVVQPHSYNILFQDAGTQEEIRKHMDAVRSEWSKQVSGVGQLSAGATVRALTTHQDIESLVKEQTQQQLSELFKEFVKTNAATDGYTAIDRLMYWEAGQYLVEMVVSTTRPDVEIAEEWMFELTPDDIKSLRLNSVVILRETCNQSATYNFAFPAYQRATPDDPE